MLGFVTKNFTNTLLILLPAILSGHDDFDIPNSYLIVADRLRQAFFAPAGVSQPSSDPRMQIRRVQMQRQACSPNKEIQ